MVVVAIAVRLPSLGLLNGASEFFLPIALVGVDPFDDAKFGRGLSACAASIHTKPIVSS